MKLLQPLNDWTRSRFFVSCNGMNSRGNDIKSLVWVMNLIVVGDPGRQLTHYGLGVRSRTDADAVRFDCANEGFSHSAVPLLPDF